METEQEAQEHRPRRAPFKVTVRQLSGDDMSMRRMDDESGVPGRGLGEVLIWEPCLTHSTYLIISA